MYKDLTHFRIRKKEYKLLLRFAKFVSDIFYVLMSKLTENQALDFEMVSV